MSALKQRLKEDRQLRNAARAIIVDQYLRVRGGMSGKRVGQQLADRVSDDLIEGAREPRKLALASVPLVAAIAGAIAIWFARKPIMQLMDEREAEHDE